MEKLETDVDSSCFFLLPNSDPRKRSFSFLGFSLSLSWLFDFLPNSPFFSFFTEVVVVVELTETTEELDSVRVRGGRSMCATGAIGAGIAPVRCCIDMPGGAACDRGGAAPDGRSCFSGTAGLGGEGTRPGGRACWYCCCCCGAGPLCLKVCSAPLVGGTLIRISFMAALMENS